jgi:Cu-processing system ATP-binding protein
MIEIKELSKSYGKLDVLKGISLKIPPGSITAILGPNGSGKTTLIKSMLGLVKPDAGDIYFDGEKINGSVEYKRKIGYMPQIARFPENLTVAEILRMIKDLRSNETDCDETLYHDFHLSRELAKPIRTLSGGTRQKLSAVVAFLFRPKTLFLDEPTAGLDPLSSSQLKDKILREKANGRTFVLTSHVMSEIEELADRLVFLQDGNIFYNGELQQMIHQTGEQKLERAIARILEGEVQ